MHTGRLSRSVVAGLSTLGVLSLALLPPQHLHETRTHDGHHFDLIHRHFDAHHDDEPAPGIGHDEESAPRWLDSPFTSPAPPAGVDRVDARVDRSAPSQALEPTRARMLPFVSFSVHDPPQTTRHGLRAPPFLLV